MLSHYILRKVQQQMARNEERSFSKHTCAVVEDLDFAEFGAESSTPQPDTRLSRRVKYFPLDESQRLQTKRSRQHCALPQIPPVQRGDTAPQACWASSN